MSSTLLDRPVRRAAAPVRPRSIPAVEAWRGPPSRRPEPRTALILALLAHAVVILLVLRLDVPHIATTMFDGSQREQWITLQLPSPLASGSSETVVPPQPGRSETPARAEEAQPQLIAPTVVPRGIPAAPAPSTPTSRETERAAATGETTVGDRVGPRMTDGRLWTLPPLPDEPALTPDEAVRARIGARLGAYNDSVRLADAAAAKAVDWTVKDKNGGRWGVSPKGIHLGGITLPLPIQFSPPPGRRDDVNAALRNWSEIQAQRSHAEVREEISDRIKAIRARKDAERKDTSRVSGSS